MPSCKLQAPFLLLQKIYQETLTHVSQETTRINMGGLILGINTLYTLFCFFGLFAVVGKGSIATADLCGRHGNTNAYFLQHTVLRFVVGEGGGGEDKPSFLPVWHNMTFLYHLALLQYLCGDTLVEFLDDE